MPLDRMTRWQQAAPEMARCSKLAYRPELPSGYPFDEMADIGDANIRVLANNKVGIVAVRGSEANAGDWAVNISTSIQKYHGMELHSGFFKSATACLSGLHAMDLPDVFRHGPVYLTGHSQGGAVSAVLSQLIKYESQISDPVCVVGFGVPRYAMGDSAFMFRGELVAICDPEDPVSQVPRKFGRAGLQVYIGENGFTAHTGSELKRLIGYVYRFFRLQWLAGKTAIAHHSMDGYVRRTTQALARMDR